MQNDKKIGLFVEDYRPQVLDDYVGNEDVIAKVRQYIDSGNPPHLLLHGVAGTGKTTLAKIIANETNSDVKYINASDENGVDAIRKQVKNFASKVAFSDFKLIILDEADFITQSGQSILRNIMETYSKSTRFILTCNYVEKIIDPIQSRCTVFEIIPPSQKVVAKRMIDICDNEGIEYDIHDIAKILDSTYPDIRRALSSLQQQSLSGKLVLDKASVLQIGYADKIIDTLKSTIGPGKKFKECRQILADTRRKSFEDLYRVLYDRVNEYCGEGNRAQAILDIAESMNNDALAVDKEINVAALIIKLIGNQ